MESLDFFYASVFFISGLILGSFFNVLIYRLPRGESIIQPGSRCPLCGRPIQFIENIPLLSYMFLGGRCAGCKKKISLQYPLVEFITASLLLFLWRLAFVPFTLDSHTWWEYAFLFLRIGSLLILIPISVIDFKHYIIPDSITLGGLILGIIFSFMPGSITPIQSLFGILAGGGSLFLVGLIGEFLLKKEAMGGGDIKLMAFLGAVWGWKIILISIILGSLLGSIAGLLLIIARALSKDHKIPFGPFLATGVWFTALFGEKILTAYMIFFERLFF